MKELDKKLIETIRRYYDSGIEQQLDYNKFYIYSLVTHSTAIEGSTVTEIENQLLFDEGIAAKGRSINEQMMNLDLKNAYMYGFEWAMNPKQYTPEFLCELAAMVMRRTGSEYSTVAGNFDSSKGDLRLCNVSAGVGGSSYLPYHKIKNAVENFCNWLNEELSAVDNDDIASCYRLSFEVHFRIVTIHPWVDGNGRTSRLLMNMVQRQLGLVPSIVSKENKVEYIQALIDSREKEDSVIIQDVMMKQHIANLDKRILQYQNSVGDTVNETKSDTVKMKDTIKYLLSVIKEHPEYTYEEYAKTIGVGRATISRYIKKLNGSVIKRIGADKNGYWEIVGKL